MHDSLFAYNMPSLIPITGLSQSPTPLPTEALSLFPKVHSLLWFIPSSVTPPSFFPSFSYWSPCYFSSSINEWICMIIAFLCLTYFTFQQSHKEETETLWDNLTHPVSDKQFQNSAQGSWCQAPWSHQHASIQRNSQRLSFWLHHQRNDRENMAPQNIEMIHLVKLDSQLLNRKSLLWIILNFPSTLIVTLWMKRLISDETSPLTNDKTSSKSVSDAKSHLTLNGGHSTIS